MSDLIPREIYDPARASRRTRKAVEEIKEAAAVRQAALEAAARDALKELEVRESLALYRAQSRIGGTYGLAEYAGHRATQLNHSNGQRAQDNPGLGLILRGYENTAAATSDLAIYRYGTG